MHEVNGIVNKWFSTWNVNDVKKNVKFMFRAFVGKMAKRANEMFLTLLGNRNSFLSVATTDNIATMYFYLATPSTNPNNDIFTLKWVLLFYRAELCTSLAYVQRCLLSLYEKTLGQSYHRRICSFSIGYIYVSVACSIVVEKRYSIIYIYIFNTDFLCMPYIQCLYNCVSSLLPVEFDNNPFVQRVCIFQDDFISLPSDSFNI